MDKDRALRLIWNYMRLGHRLEPAEAIFVLGNQDLRVAAYAARLWLEGWAPLLLFSGSGSIHEGQPGRAAFAGSTEAEVFAGVARELGVPEEAMLLETRSQNTGDNYRFSAELLRAKGLAPRTVIAVQKPYMERRVYATGRVCWPEVALVVTSPPIPLEDYPDPASGEGEQWIHAMVGDLRRIRDYPARGFQIAQEIPSEVWQAYERLVALGYTRRLPAD